VTRCVGVEQQLRAAREARAGCVDVSAIGAIQRELVEAAGEDGLDRAVVW
jgi:hypothetical protein